MISGRHKELRVISATTNFSEKELAGHIGQISEYRWMDGSPINIEEVLTILDSAIGKELRPELMCRENQNTGDQYDLYIVAQTAKRIAEKNREMRVDEVIRMAMESTGRTKKSHNEEQDRVVRKVCINELAKAMESMRREEEEEREPNIQEDDEIEKRKYEDKEEERPISRRAGRIEEDPVKRSLAEKLKRMLLQSKGSDEREMSQIKEISEIFKASPIYASKEMKAIRDLRIAEKSLMTKAKSKEISTHVVVDVSGSMEKSWGKAVTVMRIISRLNIREKVYYGGEVICHKDSPLTAKEAIKEMLNTSPGGTDNIIRWIREMKEIMQQDRSRKRNLVIITDDMTIMRDEDAKQLIEYVERESINLVLVGARAPEDDEDGKVYLPNKLLDRYGISL